MRLNNTLASAMAVALLLAGVSLARTEGRVVGVASIETASTTKSDDGSSKHEMSAKDLKQRLDKGEKIVIIDARAGLNGQIVKGAVLVPEDKVEEWAKTADKAAVIVTYCTCPHDETAESEMHKLRELGFQNAFSLTGGLNAARTAGIEVVAPKE
jgi:rhodanese-related sulfurtransferase